MKFVIWVIILICLCLSPVLSAAKEVKKDLDGDGFAETALLYNDDGELVRISKDQDQDGRADDILEMKGGEPRFRKLDSNLDGAFDVFQELAGEQVQKTRKDSDFNGKIDLEAEYSGEGTYIRNDRNEDGDFEEETLVRDGKVISRRLDLAENGLVEEEYREGELWRRQVDRNHDGRPESEEIYNPGGKPARVSKDENGDGKWDYRAEYNETGGLLRIAEGISESGVRKLTEYSGDGAAVVKEDKNLNGIWEKVAYYQDDRLAKEEFDEDEDGKAEKVKTYQKDRILIAGPGKAREELIFNDSGSLHRVDRDGDGLWESVTRYGASGRTERIDEDVNRDGKVDRVSDYRKGVLHSIAIDTNGDGTFNLKDYFDDRLQRVKRVLDDDGDGRPEAEYRYRNDKIVASKEDLDGDGSVDVEYEYDESEEIILSRNDEDGDGVFELIWHYDEQGDGFQAEYDQNKDGFYETLYEFDRGRLQRVSVDRNEDGEPDLKEVYEGGDKLVYLEKDNDYDGNFEIKQEF